MAFDAGLDGTLGLLIIGTTHGISGELSALSHSFGVAP
jgi:hypothetical protein